MNKSIHFSGQPTLSFLLHLIPKDIVYKCIKQHSSDRYYKKFGTWNHLATMLFAAYGGCTSLREVVTGMRAFEGRLLSSGVKYFPARSTLAEANEKRSSEVFADIYFALKQHWNNIYPDSRKESQLYVIDSTVISLFQEIFRGSGSSKADGRRKGGVKVHMALPVNEACPCVVHIDEGASNDINFHKHLTLAPGSTVIMDMGYRHYVQYNLWTELNIRWVTRLRERTYYTILKDRIVDSRDFKAGIQQDMEVELGFPQKKTQSVHARIITYTDPQTQIQLQFVTNDFKARPTVITDLYRKRWNIELLFKRLKQNMPLQYFLGDNKNAIQTQIWCALIADLLLNVVRRQVKRAWAFSTIVSLVRLHLFNYLNLYSFLENPERCRIHAPNTNHIQLNLNLSG